MFFKSPEQEAREQFQQEMEQRQNDSDNQIVSSLYDPKSVALDPQVSALLLEIKSRFLKWIIDPKNPGQLRCVEKYPYKEPMGEEALCFLEAKEEKKVVLKMDGYLSQIHTFGENYDKDMSRPFNSVVNYRTSFLVLSRSTGNAPKVAKSQYVESSAAVRREIVGGPQKKGGLMGGLLG